jgi:hypothetical protein
MFKWPCIVDTVKGKEPTRCDKVCSFIASTCFGHQYAPYQEFKLTQHTHKLPHTPSNPTHPVSTRYTNNPYTHTHTHTHKTNDPSPHDFTSLTNSLLAKPPHCNTLHHNTRAHYFTYIFQAWPPKSVSYLLIVLLIMGILVSETCWGNKTAYFVASSWFYTCNCVYEARSHEHQIFSLCLSSYAFFSSTFPSKSQ